MKIEEKISTLITGVKIASMHHQGIETAVNEWWVNRMRLPKYCRWQDTVSAIVKMGYDAFFLLTCKRLVQALEPSGIFCVNCNKFCNTKTVLQDTMPSLVSSCCEMPFQFVDTWQIFMGKMVVVESPVVFLADYLYHAGIRRKNETEAEAW